MHLHSPAFETGRLLPVEYTRDGEGASPPVSWHDVPEGAKELALVLEEVPGTPFEDNREEQVDAPRTLWVAYGIPADADGLPGALPHDAEIADPVLVKQGKNPDGKVGYDAPGAPRGNGARHYRFRLLALDHEVDLPGGADVREVQDAFGGHVIGEAAGEVEYGRL